MTGKSTLPEKPYVFAFKSGRLVMVVCAILLLIALSIMLGIRIEKYQRPYEAFAPENAPSVIPPAPVEPMQALPETDTNASPSAASAATPEAAPAPSPVAAMPTQTTAAPAPAAAEKPKPMEPAPAPEPQPKPAAVPPKKVEPSKPAPPPTKKEPPKTQYAIQVSASKDRAMSASEADILKNKGLPAYVEEIVAADKSKLYRVKVGPFSSEAEANKVKSQLVKDSRFAGAYIRPVGSR
jgi:cell division septation protein DedD